MTGKRHKKRAPTSASREIGIIIAGFFGGILPGISVKIGISIDPNNWSNVILRGLCNISGQNIPFNCYAPITLISLLVSLLVAFWVLHSVWKQAVRIKKIRILSIAIPGFAIGLALYGIGFLLGILAVVKLLP